MSTAAFVPETRELDGDDALATLRQVGVGRFLMRAIQRFRAADGFSHARSLGFLIALILVQGLIAVVGFATAFGDRRIAPVIARAIEGVVPSPAGQTLRESLEQAATTGASHRYTALLLGLAGAIVTGVTAFGQIERGANRIYGVEKDRPTRQKYGLALLLTLTAGVAATASFVLLAVGWEVGRAIENDSASRAWGVARWPLGVLLLVAVITAIFRWSPRRHQPHATWMVVGGLVSVLVWMVASLAMGLFLHNSSSFGETYGPLAGLVALLFWSFFTGIAVFLGLAVAAQLEAERAGVPEPVSETKVQQSEPRAQGAAPVTIDLAGARS
jgi:YihY family inner membrane protein